MGLEAQAVKNHFFMLYANVIQKNKKKHTYTEVIQF